MKKIIRKINLVILRNEEWISFFRDFKQFVEDTTAKVLKVERLFSLFLPLYNLADEIIEQIRKSKVTVRIADLDKLRDNTFHGLVYAIKSYRYHFDTIKAAAAKSLETILDHYKDLADRPYEEESAGIQNFLQEIRTHYKNEVEVLELNPWLEELEQNNEEFKKAMLERTYEAVDKPEIKILDVRKETDQSYKKIVEHIEAFIILKEEEAEEEGANKETIEEELKPFRDFVKVLNANIKYYLDTIAQRKGRVKNDDENDAIKSININDNSDDLK
jgi:hypothetical protein